MEGKYSERLSRFILTAIYVTLIGAVCWYFKSVLIYIILAAVVAMVAKPLYAGMKKINVKGHGVPDAVAAVISIICIFALLIGVVMLIFPVVTAVISDISGANVSNIAQSMSAPLESLNERLVNTFGLDKDFSIEGAVFSQIQDIFSVSTFSGVLGSVASAASGLFVTLFAMIFISFFFIKNPKLSSGIILAFVPDRYEQKTKESLGEISHLISRYFIGLIAEVLGVSILNFLGLLLVARMGFRYSLGIAALTGVLNIVPYVGPLIGGVIGVCLSLLIKYVCASSFGLAVGFPVFLAVLLGVFIFTQLIDNYVFQPLIYSSSIKAHPLEIFIVLLMAANVGGIVGMLVAIPTYTVIRVFAVKFFGDTKVIRKLTLPED